MSERLIRAARDDEGKRLDAFLSEKSDDLSRNAIQQLIEDGSVTMSGRPVKKNYKICGNEEFCLQHREARDSEVKPENIDLDIVYEDADVVVINKPQGMVVHPAAGHHEGTLVNALLFHCKDSLSGINGEIRPGIVHRIDKNTSGLLIVAKNDRAHNHLAKQIKEHSASRIYEAVVIGNIKSDEGAVNAPIGRHPTKRKQMAITDKNSRNAVTHYQVLARYPGYTYVRCILETGRTHQIRVHLASLGHPVLGDDVYGPSKNTFGLSGQCLHAREISFRQPTTGELISLKTELPEYFMKVLKKIGS